MGGSEGIEGQRPLIGASVDISHSVWNSAPTPTLNSTTRRRPYNAKGWNKITGTTVTIMPGSHAVILEPGSGVWLVAGYGSRVAVVLATCPTRYGRQDDIED